MSISSGQDARLYTPTDATAVSFLVARTARPLIRAASRDGRLRHEIGEKVRSKEP
jgi:hypothetical protein